MLELRRALIDEVETILKEFVVKYDREVRYVGGLGRGWRAIYFPEECARRWPILLGGLKWVVWERERGPGEEDGPFHRTSGAVFGWPEESWVYGYMSRRIIEWMRRGWSNGGGGRSRRLTCGRI